MSMLGGLAAAIGGGAQAINQQAVGDIEQQRRVDIAKETAAIEEQMRNRLADRQETRRREGMSADFDFTNDPKNVGRSQATARSNALATAGTARQAVVEGVNDTAYQGARTKQGDTDAADAARREREATKAAGSDTDMLKAKRALALAGHIESAASSAQAALARLQADDLKRLGGEYDKYIAIQNDPKLSDDEKAKRLKPIVTTITAIKSKTGQGGGRDPELDTETITEERMNPDGTTTKVQRKQVRRPGGGAEAPGKPATEADAQAQAAAAIKAGAKREAVEAMMKGWGYAMPGGAPAPAAKPAATPMLKSTGAKQEAPDSAEGAALDAAKQAANEAQSALMKFGSQQRQRDPNGFKEAQAKYESAKAALAAAEAAYRSSVPATSAAIRFPAP